MPHYRLDEALIPFVWLYDHANELTLSINRSRLTCTGILIYRVASVPLGTLAVAISVAQVALTAFLTVITLGNSTCAHWTGKSLEQGYDCVRLVFRSTFEIYYVAKAILFGSYRGSFIFYDSDFIEREERLERWTNYTQPMLNGNIIVNPPQNNNIVRPPQNNPQEEVPEVEIIADYDVLTVENDIKIAQFCARNPTDFTMRVRGNQTAFTFHKDLLKAVHSPFLRALVNNPMQENINNEANDFECTVEAMAAFKRFIYSGFSTNQIPILLELLQLADMMDFSHLTSHCCEMLKNKIDTNNITRCLTTASLIDSAKFQHMCFAFIKANMSQVHLQLIHSEGLGDAYANYLALINQPPNQNQPVNPQENPTKMFERGILRGVTFNTEQNETVVADRLILDLKSTSLSNYFAQQPQGDININLRVHSKKTVDDLLTFIYNDEIDIPALELVSVYNCAIDLLGERDKYSEKLFKIATKKIKKNITTPALYELQAKAHQLHSTKLINFVTQTLIGHLLHTHRMSPHNRNGQNPFNDIIQPLGRDSFYLTELKLSDSVHRLNTHNENRTYHDFANWFCQALARWCPNLQVLELPPCSNYVYNPSQTDAMIRSSRIFESCPFLQSIKVGMLVVSR